MNKQFIITNFAAFALMLFLPTGCRQADGKQDAVQSYRVIKVSPVEIFILFRRHTQTAVWTSSRRSAGAFV